MSMVHTGTGARGAQNGRRAAAGAAALLLAAAGMAGVAPAVSAQSSLNVKVGVGDGGVAGQAFQTGQVTVLAGDSVTFSIASDEPHTITLGKGPEDAPPPFWPVTGFTAPAEGTQAPYDLGTATFDGTNFVNTGILQGKTSKATVTFSAAGSFEVFCAIHPGMAGQVDVVESGTATTQAEADAAAALTSDLLLGQVDGLRQERLAATTTTDNADGTKTWNVFVDASTEPGPMPGGGKGYLELLEFTPAGIPIGVGDTVHWTANEIHTVTFLPEGTNPQDVFTSQEAAFAPMGGTSYDGTEPASSGILNFPPAGGPEYSLTFPAEGVYPFFCILHADLGQVGMVAVGVPLPEPPA